MMMGFPVFSRRLKFKASDHSVPDSDGICHMIEDVSLNRSTPAIVRNDLGKKIVVLLILLVCLLIAGAYLSQQSITRKSASQIVERASELLLIGEASEAQQEIEKLLRVDGDNCQALLLAGLCDRELHNWDRSKEFFERAKGCSEDPLYVESVSVEYALTHVMNWEFDRGISLLSEHLVKYPKSDKVRSSLISVSQKLRRSDIAEEFLESRYELFPSDISVLLDLLQISDVESTVDSIFFLEEVNRVRPHQSLVNQSLGEAYYEDGQIEKAEAHFKVAISIKPELLGAQLRLAELYLQQGNLSEAENILRDISDAESSHRYWSVMSLRAEVNERYDEALDSIEKTLVLSPCRPEYLARKSKILRLMNRLEDASDVTSFVAEIAEAKFQIIDYREKFKSSPPSETQCLEVAALCRIFGKDKWADGWETWSKKISEMKNLSRDSPNNPFADAINEFYPSESSQ
jgi:tetratricopeptide (TPR) repeat protein